MSDERTQVYAQAFFAIASAENALSSAEDELFRFARAVDANDELRKAITDQTLPAGRRMAIVEELMGQAAHPVSTQLAAFVVGTGRGRDLGAVVDAFVRLAAEERNHEVAEVRSAIALDADQVARLEVALSTKTGKRIEVKVIVDPTVMGGLVARIGDTVIDGSVRHRLDQLRERI